MCTCRRGTGQKRLVCRLSVNTERLEQFSSIGRSPIVKPFMPAGYARHFFFVFFFFFGIGALLAYSCFSLSCRSNVIVFGYSSFPLSRLLVSCAKAPLTLGRASRSPRYYDVTVSSFTLSLHLVRTHSLLHLSLCLLLLFHPFVFFSFDRSFFFLLLWESLRSLTLFHKLLDDLAPIIHVNLE